MIKEVKARILSWIKRKLGIVSPSEVSLYIYSKHYKHYYDNILAITGTLITQLEDKVGD